MSPASSPADLPEEAYAVALAATPSIGPAALRALLTARSPSEAWRQATAGSGASADQVARVWERHLQLGISVLTAQHPSFPPRLVGDPEAPALLFCLGEPAVLGDAPTVALVGTRAPTRYGIGVAAQLGADLSAAGVSIVSGLALGIDGAAHEGACGAGAPPIGVVAGGLDDPYPRRHARLWARVAAQGAVVSESPAGVPTERWRFPVRNRLLAALSDVVVVVESRHHGGSRHTVDAAVARGIPVGSVPGSIRSPTSEGTNALVAEGAFPVCSAGDVLLALSLEGVTVATAAPTGRPVAPTSGEERLVYGALSPDPAPLDELVRRTGLELGALCGVLQRLARAGLAHDSGGWWERT
ncbi:MAG: DNA-protecting protein DprA [Acidimicrobiales bacterium]|nr:DNA-protecting protein DprA [Acidimicrobiales bacterium]